jgi:RND family efflux transporter MFP subunit
MGNAKRIVWFCLLVLPLILSGCKKDSKTSGGASPPGSESKSEQKALTVTYSLGLVHSVDRTLPLVGTIVVDKSISVPSLATGQIVDVFCSQGDRVSQGQVLATVDTGDSQLAVKKAQAELAQELAVLGLDSTTEKLRDLNQIPSIIKAKATMDNAKENLDRYEKLHKQHLVSDIDYSNQKTSFITAKADYDAALESVSQNLASVEAAKMNVAISQKKVTDAVVVAPVGGIVDSVTTAQGAYVSAGAEVGITLLKDRPLFVALDVPQNHLSEFGVGKIITFKTQVYPDRRLTARVAQVGGRVNPKSGALPSRAQILAPPEWLQPGLSAEVELLQERMRDQLLVPQAAVLTQAGESSVFLVASTAGKTATLKVVPVKTGQAIDDWIVIHGEVTPTDKLITSDLLGIDNGTKVELGKELEIEIPEALR